MTTKESEKAWEFKKIKLEDMVNYIVKNHPEDKAWFKSVAFKPRKQKVAVPQFNADGTPIMTKAKTSKTTGKVSAPRQKVKMVEVKDSESKPVFSLLDAKIAFCTKYMPNILPKKKEEPAKAEELMKDW